MCVLVSLEEKGINTPSKGAYSLTNTIMPALVLTTNVKPDNVREFVLDFSKVSGMSLTPTVAPCANVIDDRSIVVVWSR